MRSPFVLLAHASSSSRPENAGLTIESWPTTAFAGQGKTTGVLASALSLSPPPLSSLRLTGTLTAPSNDSYTFSIDTAGSPQPSPGCLLWIDDHLVVDGLNSSVSRHLAPFAVPLAAAAPTLLRLECCVASAAASAAVRVLWANNASGPAGATVVPLSALAPDVPPFEVDRAALRERLYDPDGTSSGGAGRWQTYYNPSMGTHVMMPQGFAVAATLGNLSSGATLGRIFVYPMAAPARVRIGGHSYNGSAFTELTIADWNGVPCETTLATTVTAPAAESPGDAETTADPGLQLLATSVARGPNACDGLVLLVEFQMLWGRAGAGTLSAPGVYTAALPGFPNVTVWASDASLPFPGRPGDSAFAMLLAPGEDGAGAVGVNTGPSRVPVAAMATNIAAARAAHDAARARFGGGDLSDAYDAQQSVIAWNTMFTPYEGVVTPISRGTWAWDSGYVLGCWDQLLLSWMAGLEPASRDLAYNNVLQILLPRTLSGFVPNFATGLDLSYDRSEPQVGSLVVRELHARFGDAWLVQKAFGALLSWSDWAWEHRRGDGVLGAGTVDGRADLLSLGSDPNAPATARGGYNNMQSARFESGLDNGPAYDLEGPAFAGYPYPDFNATATHRMSLYDVGASALFAADALALAELAPVAGRLDAVPRLAARAAAVQAAMNAHMWNAAEGVYENVLYNGSFYPRRMPTAFYPLLSGAASDAQAAATAAGVLASPLGFCANASFYGNGGDADSALLQTLFAATRGDNLLCASDACVADAVNSGLYEWAYAEGMAQLAPAPDGSSTVPLYQYFNGRDNALTTNATPPRADYALVRIEAHCYASETGGLGSRVPLSLWHSAARDEYQTCAGPHCAVDVRAMGYALVTETMCWAANASAVGDMPCKFGLPSVARAHAAFRDQNYWRGRIWAPQVALVWLGLRGYSHVPAAAAARASVAAQALRLELQDWRLFRHVNENVNGLVGVGQDNALGGGESDPMYHWGALLGHVALLEAGF